MQLGPAALKRIGTPRALVQVDDRNPLGRARSYRFATNRTRIPFAGSVSGSGFAYQASTNRFYTPGYDQTDLRICIPNFYCPQLSSAPYEIACEAGRVVEGVSVKIGSTFYPCTINGSSSYTFTSDKPWVWTDPLPGVIIPKNSYIDVILADYTPVGQKQPRTYDPFLGRYGDGVVSNSTTCSSYLTSGTVSPPGYVGPTAAGPIAIVARGAPAGQIVPLIVGMSITSGSSTNIANLLGAKKDYGYVDLGFSDDTPGVGRFPFGRFAVGGTDWPSISAANFAYRAALLAEVGNPFSVIYCEHGQNDVGAGYSTLKARADAGWAYLKTLGGRRLVHGGINPVTTDSTNDKWSVPASQATGAGDTKPSGARWQFHDYCAGLPTNVDAFVDLTSYFIDGTYTDRWKAMGRNSILASGVSSGTTISVTGTPPIVGDDILIGAGASGGIVRNVGSVTGSGPYTVSFSTNEAAIASSFSAGAAVRAVPTKDGIHPTGTLHAEIVAGIIAAKQARVFG